MRMSDLKGKPYDWFQGDSVVELYNRLTEYGPHNAILKVYQHGGKMYFSIEGDEDDPIDDSRLCPINCPPPPG